ncbi:MAG: 23S rRNA (adenine(2503)-C(2))-methyltransferase RlmN [Gemmataceae bacterium]|nr:23S rRNA (adenine(2503)-C(2))-methyltransferase RlmN [Gemmataceae bacterium]
MVSIHDCAGIEALRHRLRLDPDMLRRWRNAFFKQHRDADEAFRELPPLQRAELAAAVTCHHLELLERHDSQLDGASKLLFRTARGHRIETVILRIASGRTAVCVSSQAGCAARCGFCATGHMGFAQDLTAAEILDQVALANRILRPEGRSIRNVVFMGMGEPLHNEEAVYQSVGILQSPRYFDLAPGRILVSTVGIPDAMVRCAERLPRARVALSLHSARQEQRERLIPLARRYPLAQLRAAAAAVAAQQQRPLMIEYLLLDGVNDTTEDLAALADFLHGLPAHVNLIPYNPIADAPHLHPTPSARRREFAASLSALGFRVTVRYSLGADIAAACGQLVHSR